VTDPSATRSRLEGFFSERSDDPSSLRITGYEPIIGGYSRAMARVWVEDSSGRRGYVLRSDPPPGQSIIDTDRDQEWALLNTLYKSGTVPLPAPLWYDATGKQLGSKTIVMEMIEAESLLARSRQVTDQTVFEEFDRKLCEVASAIHTLALDTVSTHIPVPTSWDDYIEGCIQRWADAERNYPSGNPMMRFVAAWLRANKPPPAPLSLVHGDFQSANILVDNGEDLVVVDWELARIGDPREDLGWWILGRALQAPEVPDPTEETFYAPYRSITGLTEEQVNPATVAYFTVLASEAVFTSVFRKLALVAAGETTSMMIAYMSNAIVGMHGEFVRAIDLNESLRGGR
jgi:aminoglycoside phosphotransferase (APT) family kinase protein